MATQCTRSSLTAATASALPRPSRAMMRGSAKGFSHATAPRVRPERSASVRVVGFQFMKDLGFKKPEWLPDFGKDKRKALLDRFYSEINPVVYDELLSDDLVITEYVEPGGKPPSKFGKKDWTNLMVNHTLPSVPDFNWTHDTSGEVDKEGYAIVTVQATGHFKGKPFSLPSFNGPPFKTLEPTGKRFRLEPEVQKVKVEKGKITAIVVLPNPGAGPLALYKALGGEVPTPSPAPGMRS